MEKSSLHNLLQAKIFFNLKSTLIRLNCNALTKFIISLCAIFIHFFKLVFLNLIFQNFTNFFIKLEINFKNVKRIPGVRCCHDPERTRTEEFNCKIWENEGKVVNLIKGNHIETVMEMWGKFSSEKS